MEKIIEQLLSLIEKMGGDAVLTETDRFKKSKADEWTPKEVDAALEYLQQLNASYTKSNAIKQINVMAAKYIIIPQEVTFTDESIKKCLYDLISRIEIAEFRDSNGSDLKEEVSYVKSRNLVM